MFLFKDFYNFFLVLPWAMENIFQKIFKISLDPIFDQNINLERQEFVIKKILEIYVFIIRKKTNIRFSEHFFMDFNEDFIIEKLTTLKYNSEFFSFKSVSITINEKENDNSIKSNYFLIDDFHSEIYKDKLKKFYNELITIKKESNWSILSLKDILDVDYRKQTEKADAFFIRGEYSDALKIYSKFKTEDDFSHYNMEMEVYCRYLLGSNPYSNLIHLTNTNFVNSFYHHRLVIISLLIGKNDFCYRISRLLNEPYKMFIDLELSNRFLKGNRFNRKGLDLLFFCILYYRSLNFPCDKLIDQFISSVDQNEKILEEPLKCLKNLKSSPENCGIDIKTGIDCLYKDLFPIRFNEQRYLIMIKYKDDEHNLYITFDKTLNVCTHDKIYIFYIYKFRNSLKYTINDQLPVEIETKDAELDDFYNKHVVFESDIDFKVENGTFFTLKDFVNQIDEFRNGLSWCKEAGFDSEGSVVLDGLGVYNDLDILIDTKIQINSNSRDSFFVNHEHVLYQNQIYNLEITKPEDYCVLFEGSKTYQDNIDLKFDDSGFYYLPLKIISPKKTYSMFIKFTVITHYFINFSWSNIFPFLLTINIFNPTNTKVKVLIDQIKTENLVQPDLIKDVKTDSCHKIDGKIYKSNDFFIDKSFYNGQSCDIMPLTSSYENKLKREILGIEDQLIEDFQDGELEINSPVTTSLDFSDFLNKQEHLIFDSKGFHSIQIYPKSTGLYNITLENEQQTFIIPFNIDFIKTEISPFIYIISSNLIRADLFVKIFCLINNPYDKDLFIEIDSNTIEINQKDTKLRCLSLKASIFEIRCKFLTQKVYLDTDFQIKVFDDENKSYKYNLCVDLKVL